MGLNEPFLARYAQWLGNALTGDLGTSYKDGMPVAGKLTHALRYTLILSVASLAVSLIVSLPLAVISAVKKDGILDNIVKLLSFIGNSLPNFLISVLLMYFFCVKTDLLPVLADESVKGLILPCLALAIPMCSRFLRQFRAEVLEQLGRDYVLGAKARGVKSSIILFKNVLHNAAIPVLTIVALSIGSLLGGSVVVETDIPLAGDRQTRHGLDHRTRLPRNSGLCDIHKLHICSHKSCSRSLLSPSRP